MTRYYRRIESGRSENLRAGFVAGALAATVGAVSFYLVRLFLSKEALEPPPLRTDEDENGRGPVESEL